jgi:tetratricopeptide (TPR) repeat protein
MSSATSIFIREIQRVFPETVWPWLIRALRHDSLVWEFLTSEAGQKNIDLNATPQEGLSPANLALLAMRYPISAESLRVEPMPPVDLESEALASSEPGAALMQAGRDALCLRERRRLLGSWDGLFNDLLLLSPTAVACLFGMLSDPQELFRVLLGGTTSPDSLEQAATLTVHALLSNPQSPAEQYGFASQLLQELPTAAGIQIIKKLERYAPRLSADLAGDLATHLQKPSFPPVKVDENTILEHVSELAKVAEAQMLAEHTEQAVSMIKASIQAARMLEARLTARKARFLSAIGDEQGALQAWESASQLDPSSIDLLGQTAMALLNAGRTAEAQTILASAQGHDTLIHIARARLAFLRDNEEQARSETQQALEALEEGNTDSNPVIPEHTLPAAHLAGILMQLNQPAQAARAAQIAASQTPNDADIQALLARAQWASGNLEGAVLSSHVSACLEPSRLDLRRDLTERLELTGDWKSALIERKRLTEELDPPSIEDLRALSECALNAGDARLCLQVCEQILEHEPQDGIALAWQGEALAAFGETEPALESLQQAIQIAPSLAIPWLSLAKFYQSNNQNQKALETLRAATYAAPDDALIHLKLGEAYIEGGSPTQALSDLRLAAELASQEQDGPESEVKKHRMARLQMVIALRLGQTLGRLGHQEEAHQVLEEAYHQAPSNPEIARGYAQVLLAEGELPAALEPLETILDSQSADLAAYLDYAGCVLELHQRNECGISLEKVIPALNKALELQPGHPKATAMLGEALLGCGKPVEARAAFSQALLSDLGQDPLWQVRLSLGLGQAALQLGEPETAVAALQEANRIDPLNPKTQRCLSQAYLEAGLADEAFQSARAALLLAPTDVDMLIWFADQSMKLHEKTGSQEVQQEALNALKRAAQISPSQPELAVKLGQMQMRFGENALARQTFLQLITEDEQAGCSQGTAKDYQVAAHCLLQLGDAQDAVTCLEKAIEMSGNSEAGMLILLTDLAIARKQAGDQAGALEIINQAITAHPYQATLYLMKADLLSEISLRSQDGRDSSHETVSSEILDCLQIAIKLKPDDPDLHERVANIYRQAGDLRQASAHAKRMLDVCGETLPQRLRARALAADLAIAQLQPDIAQGLLELDLPAFESTSEAAEADTPEYYLLRAECALEAGEEYVAANELVTAGEITPNHSALMSLQARLAFRRNDPQSAMDLLTSGLLAASDLSRATPLINRMLAIAALEMGQWEQAIQLHNRLVQNYPQEPLSHLALARTLVLCAERQRLCQALEVVRRAPGERALSEKSAQDCEAHLLEAEDLVNRLRGALSPHVQAQVNEWRARGKAAFKPDTASAALLADLPPSPDVIAAQIAVLRQTSELTLAGYLARDYSKNPTVLLQLALALMDEKPRQAMAAAHAAADIISESSNASSTLHDEELYPLNQVLMARLYHRNGNRSGDHASAIQAIQNALAAWEDEPRWHILAAEIFLGRGHPDDLVDKEEAISHLEQAIRLDPRNASPYLSLGMIYLEEGQPEKTIQVCEQASRLAPDEPNTWNLLALAHQSLGNLDQAAACAESAIALAPQETAYLVLRGEIALEASDNQAAYSQALVALENDPDNPGAMLLMARALQKLDRPEEALEVLEKAVQYVPQPLPLHLEKVRLLDRTQGSETAYQSIQELNQRYPDEPSVLALMAEILTNANEPGGAIRVAQRALRINAETATLTTKEQAELHFILGKLMRQGGQLDQSIHHLSEAAQFTPQVVDIYLELGLAHRERRQYSEALEAYQEAAKVAPKDYRSYNEMGLTLRDSKDYLGAERMLRRAAEMAPNDPAVHRSLAAVVALNLLHNRRDTVQNISA